MLDLFCPHPPCISFNEHTEHTNFTNTEHLDLDVISVDPKVARW